MSLKSSRAQFLSLVTVVWFGCFPGATSVRAATFTVNSTIDATDAIPGDGVCETAQGNGVCTLRAAIQEANFGPEPDGILLPSATYVITIPADVEPDAAFGNLNIVADLTITGGGAGSTIVDGNGSNSIFEIDAPGSPAVRISGVTITGGRGAGDGGGIHARAGTVTIADTVVVGNNARRGGGIFAGAFATVTVLRSTVAGNTADNGGGAYSKGAETLIVIDSTFSGNQAGFKGGGIATDPGARTLIANSTISGNTAGEQGGGLFASFSAVTTLLNVTMTNNSAPTGGGISGFWGHYVDRTGPVERAGASFVKNTLIAGNHAAVSPDCGMSVLLTGAFPSHTPSLGHNVIGDGTGCAGMSGPGDNVGTSGAPIDSGLDRLLADNGGPTETHALRPGPAIDAGAPAADSTILLRAVDPNGSGIVLYLVDVSSVTACPPTDQRGANRPLSCDIGAYEFVAGYTPVGNNVDVNLPPASLTFESVSQAGETQLSVGAAGPPPPAGFRLGQPPTYFDLTTTAVFSGQIQVCFDYSLIAFSQEPLLRLFHFTGMGWVDITSSLDTTANAICALTTSLSPFAIFEPAVVADTTPPVLDVPAGIVTNATGPEGVAVSFEASATDDSGVVSVQCLPASGSVFRIGTTRVSCTATDGSGNGDTAGFNVTVRGAAEQMVDMLERLRRVPLNPTIKARLLDALKEALAEPRHAARVCRALRLFAVIVQLQAGRSIPAGLAAQLIADATRIRAVLGCM